MKRLLAILLIPSAALAQQCVLQDKTVTRNAAVIAERSPIRTEVVPSFSGGKKCMVNFRVRIGAAWHTAFGEHEWAGDIPREDACAVAVKRAEGMVRDRVSASQVVTEKTLICNENPELNALRELNPGTIAELHQFRPHPELTREFWHNGARCRFILDTVYGAVGLRTLQGVICQLQDTKWVVVDKF